MIFWCVLMLQKLGNAESFSEPIEGVGRCCYHGCGLLSSFLCVVSTHAHIFLTLPLTFRSLFAHGYSIE